MEKLSIKTQRLEIRNLQTIDLDLFLAYRSIPEICQYQGFSPMDKKMAIDFIKKQANKGFGKTGEWVQYAISSKIHQYLIGDCAIKLQAPDPRIAEIGITISPLYQKQGFAKETLLGILRFLFDQKNVHRVVETVDVRNDASIRLLESIGFRKEGHFIEDSMFKGSWGSVYQYAMLEREWATLTK